MNFLAWNTETEYVGPQLIFEMVVKEREESVTSQPQRKFLGKAKC